MQIILNKLVEFTQFSAAMSPVRLLTAYSGVKHIVYLHKASPCPPLIYITQ